jgi:hypothetical protein
MVRPLQGRILVAGLSGGFTARLLISFPFGENFWTSKEYGFIFGNGKIILNILNILVMNTSRE